MDVTAYLDARPAPRAVFDNLAARETRPRFMVGTGDGDWRAVTWRAFARQIREVALYLSVVGFAPGERSAVFAPNRVEWATAALAIQSMGGVMVPVYGASTAGQAAYIVSHSDARIVFVDTPALLERVLEAWTGYANVARVVLLDDAIDPMAVLAKVRAKGKAAPSDADVSSRVVSWSRARGIGAEADAQDPERFDRALASVSLDAVGLMLYTSGTTGNPKGVPLTHRNVAVNGRDWLVSNAPLLAAGDVDLLWLPMSHIFGFGEMCLGNTLGFTSYLCDPASVMDRLREVRPNVLMSVPAYWEKIAMALAAEPDPARRGARLAEVTGGNLRFCLSGGAGLKQEIKELLYAHGLLVIEGYGLTETSPTLTLNRPGAFRFDSVGQRLPSVEVRLAEDGEILARGPSVFSGYHKDPKATLECFTDDGWFKTGDVGRFTNDGYLQIIDRKKDILVTVGGKNIPPANIELRFRDDPLIAHVLVYGDGRRYLVAGVWVDPAQAAQARAHGEDITARVAQRIEAVNSQLANYETIKRFTVFETPLTVESEMLTASLKVRRRKVCEAYRTQLDALYDDGPGSG